uniref:Uncharacterized protein n=1 Tax=Aegilops tauschii TaxID=37682 RepID=M8C7X6_AEGTA
MANLLHLPDLAAARPPAPGVARRRGRGSWRRRPGPREAGGGRGGDGGGGGVDQGHGPRAGREAGRCRPAAALLRADDAGLGVAGVSESPAATTRRDDDEEERRRYYLNLGYAIRTLREEIPDVFYKEPSFDIYRDDIVFRNPFNKFEGIDNYRSLFWGLRFTGHIFFKALWVDIVSIWQPAENLIMIRWIAHGIPRVPWDGHARFDGASVYKLDRNGKIYEHKLPVTDE